MRTKVCLRRDSILSCRAYLSLLILVTLLACSPQEAVEVSVQETPAGWRLHVEDETFYVRGAGGRQYFHTLESAGGNAVRTWNANHAQEVLDSAEANGLKVMLGLWVQHERHGFDYTDTKAVAAQFEKFKTTVEAFKNHPALLLWGVGNEVGFGRKNLEAIEAVDDIAQMIQELDPRHPVTTVTAGVQEEEIPVILKYGEHIDFISVNSYGGIDKVDERLEEYGYHGPYLITEWGPTGHWEVDTTEWGAAIEQSTTEKEIAYYERYQEHILNAPRCMGSFVFLWGQKQERTHTWYGMFDENGKPYGTVQALQQAWAGESLEPSSARIENIRLEGHTFKASETMVGGRVASFEVEGEFADDATITWELFGESKAKSSGGDLEDQPERVSWLMNNGMVPYQAVMSTPDTSGAFRIFVTVEQNGFLSTANVPFYIIRSYSD